MARIRTIKPEFFRHEKLQDLEAANPGACAMLVFCALWGHCDKHGIFEYRPRTLKLDILPFLEFDMKATLEILAGAGMIRIGEAMGKQWGSVESFPHHQRLGGKEAQDPSKNPHPDDIQWLSLAKQWGSTSEAPVKHLVLQEGKGREGKGKEEQNYVELELDSPVWPPDEPDTSSPVVEIFAHWQTVWNKPRSKLDAKRKRIIANALKLYDSETLKRAIEGYHLSPHHCGQNERSTVYDDIELFLRDAKHVDAGLAFAEKGQAPVFR